MLVVVLVMAGACVAQAFGRFTYGVLLPAVRDDMLGSNRAAGLLGTVNVAAYLARHGDRRHGVASGSRSCG